MRNIPNYWISVINGERFNYSEYSNIETDGSLLVGNDRRYFKSLPKNLYPYEIEYVAMNNDRLSLNNYTASFENFYFWMENEKTIMRLFNSDVGDTIRHQSTDDKSMYRIDNIIHSHITFDVLLDLFFKVKNKSNFIKIYNRYIRSYCDKYKISDNEYPIDFNVIVDISNLDMELYDITAIIDDIIVGVNVNYISYLKKHINLDTDILVNIIQNNIDKFTEYKNGKVGISNMFFGLYLKRIDSEKINKEKLLSEVKEFMDVYSHI